MEPEQTTPKVSTPGKNATAVLTSRCDQLERQLFDQTRHLQVLTLAVLALTIAVIAARRGARTVAA